MGKRLRSVAVLGLLAGGCNAPVAGFLDSCFPSRARQDAPPPPPDPPGPGPSVRPGGAAVPAPKGKSDNLPPPDLGPNP